MPIPDYQTLMLPLLRLTSDQKVHTSRDASAALAAEFALSLEERDQLLPSGRQAIFDNRIGWARTYLKKARLIESPDRGVFQITQRGIDALAQTPTEINNRFLEKYPEFLEFRTRSSTGDEAAPAPAEERETPLELLESSYRALQASLAAELLDRVRRMPPSVFEQLVVDLLVAMGYGGSRKDAGEAVGRSGDGGIDGIINEDRLGLERIYIQAKRWVETVGRPVVQAFAGSLEGHRARKGVLITTSKFSKEALDYVDRIEKRIVLIDGERLAPLMIEYGIGVSPEETYVICRVDSDYFGEE